MVNQITIDEIDISECGFFHPEYKNTDCHIALAFSEEYGECTKCEQNPNCYYKQLKHKEQECEKLKAKLNPKLKNAHCVYFEGQTGQCRAKEFTKCNPVNCKLYTIDELSTIVDLQNRNTKLEQECEELNKIVKAQREENNLNTVKLGEMVLKNGNLYREKEKYKQALDEIEKICQIKEENSQFMLPSVWQQILDIINKAKEN